MSIWSGGGFFARLKGNVIKWWRLTILPVFHLNNNNPSSVVDEAKKGQNVNNLDMIIQDTQESPAVSQNEAFHEQAPATMEEAASKMNLGESEMDIIARLDRERKEEEERKRREIEVARQKAQEEERIAAIMQSNKVNVNSFIEEGKASREKANTAPKETPDEEAARKAEELRRAQEIIDRLNREAAMDEAKKQAEIDAAKQQALETFGN